MKKLLLILVLLFLSTNCYADITSGLVGWWKLDDGTGSAPADSTGNGSIGNNHNSPSWVTGHIGPYALSYNGTNQYTTVANNSTISPLTTITQSFWFKTTQSANAVYDVLRHDGTFTALQISSSKRGNRKICNMARWRRYCSFALLRGLLDIMMGIGIYLL